VADENRVDPGRFEDDAREAEHPDETVIDNGWSTESVSTGTVSTEVSERPARRRGPDPLTLLVGIATLVMAVFAFAGELPGGLGLDPRWLLAGGAAVIGLALLAGSLRGRSGRRPGG
jgi:hypothetical protein